MKCENKALADRFGRICMRSTHVSNRILIKIMYIKFSYKFYLGIDYRTSILYNKPCTACTVVFLVCSYHSMNVI